MIVIAAEHNVITVRFHHIVHVTVWNEMWWFIRDEHAIVPAASKQLHNSEKEAPCNEHVKLMNSQITFELMFVYETRVGGTFII